MTWSRSTVKSCTVSTVESVRKVCGSVWTIEARKEYGDFLPTIPGIIIIYFIEVYVKCKQFRNEPKAFLSKTKFISSFTKRYTNIYTKNIFQLICCWRFDPIKDGSLFTWDRDEPSAYIAEYEDCLEVRPNYKMNDADCGESRHGLCEIKMVDCWTRE